MALSTDKYGYLADPLFSFLNEAGLPLKGGYIIACAAGTSTKVATYSDWSGEAFNPVEIPLDAAGRMVNPAIVSKTSLYKILICDASHGEENPVKAIDKVAVPGSSVEFTGPVTQGLNSAEATSGFVKVTVADNKLKIEDKINPSDFANKGYVDNAVNSEKTRAEGVEEAIFTAHRILSGDFNATKLTLEAKDAELDEEIAAVEPMVDEKVGEERTRAEAQENGIRESITEAVNILESSIEAVDAKVDTLVTKVEPLPEEIASLSQRITDEENERRSDVEGLQNAVNSKANKDTTQQAISELRAAVNSKADDYETAQALNGKADKTTVIQLTSEVANKANKTYVDTQLGYKANASDVTTALNGKADKSTTYTKTEVDNKVSPKADKTYVDNMLGNVEALLAAL